MRPFVTRRGVAALALLVVTVGVLVTEIGTTEANHTAGMSAMSIDTITAGNDADTLGQNDSCISVSPGQSVDIDVTALGIPTPIAMLGFGFTVDYDPSAIAVTEASAQHMLAVLPQSNVLDVSDAVPDSDGTFDGAALDQNTSAAASEFGSGVLMRLKIEINQGALSGLYDLTFTYAAHIDFNNHGYAPGALNDATIAVAQDCPSIFGDVDCSSAVNSVDALKVLRHGAALSVSQTEPCVDLGGMLPNTEMQGDVDCTGQVNAVDALKLLRYAAALSVSQTEPCPDVGT